MMTPERWQQVKQFLSAALEMEPARRAAYLNQVSTDDPSLRTDLDRLLAADEEAGSEFLNDPAITTELGGRFPESASLRIGRRVGAYKIVEEIGVGGMGEVYRAFRADDQYRKQVAIKLVRAGQDSRFVIDRFKNERQVLASLDHPNIARLLDGGTTEDGVPYFVMELIEGQPIDEYCDDHRLPVSERLKLFCQVCSAVQYAHQRLIIHRDLKPSNIVVTSEGIPKLLDFGIAKILDPAALVDQPEPTVSMFRLLTPGYASPEQVRGESITTVSDVYSLGVLLYELLTAHRPYRVVGGTPNEIAQAVCELQPEKPSTLVRRTEKRPSGADTVEITPAAVSAVREGSPEKLSKRLSGDLDNIVLMALRKEPQRRYASIEQFAEDIRRHLEHLPVIARNDTLGYRTSKFITRHKTGVTAAMVVVITLLAGLAVTLREAHIASEQAKIARAQRARAEQRFNDVRQLANSLMFEVHDSVKDLAGTTPARALLAGRALEYLDRLAQDAKGDVSLQRELATSYLRLGDVQGPNLGDAIGALASYRKSLAIRESLLASDPKKRELQLEVASCYDRIALLSPAQEAQDLYRRALAIREALFASDPANLQLRRELATSYEELGNSLGNPYWNNNLGDTADATDYLKRALDIRMRLFQGAPIDPEALFALFDSYHFMADMFWVSGHLEQALQYQLRAQSVMADFLAHNPANAEARRNLATGSGRMATVLEENGQFAKALVRNRIAFRDILEPFVAVEPKNALYHRQTISGYNQIGRLLLKMGDVNGATENHRKALRLSLALVAAGPENPDGHNRLANSYEGLGNALAVRGDIRGALENSLKAVVLRERLAAADPSGTQLRGSLATNLLHFGNILAKSGKVRTSLESYRKALAILEPMTQADRNNWLAERTLADVYLRAGVAESELAHQVKAGSAQFREHNGDACALFKQNLSLWQDIRQRKLLIKVDIPKAAEASQRVHDCTGRGG